MRTVLLFIDGFGWGDPDPAFNPQHAYGGELLRLPDLPAAAAGLVPLPRGGWARPLDAVLGVDGLPQSATGQTTLLSGVNAQAALGKHLTGFPNDALRAILLEHSVLRQLTDLGRRACFLNAFRPRFFAFPRERQLQFSATTVANLAADLPFFTLDDVAAGRSLYQEFTNAELRAMGFEVDPLTPAEAGRVLGRAAAAYDFVLYEYFQTDKAGHSGEPERAWAELAKLDAFLGAVLEALPPDALLLLTSDHGNLEDLRTRRHTANPVPLMAWGPGAAGFIAPLARLDQVTPAIVGRHR
ncbi:MAG: alkaline phosphatase family protein [Candidatus Krumholzibacteriia bacterium]